MPFDPTVAIVFGTLLVALLSSLLYAYWYQSTKLKHSKSRKDVSNSLTVSELEAVIKKSVEEATRAFENRLEALESQVQSLQEKVGETAKGLLTEHEEDFSARLPNAEREEEPAMRQRRRVQ